MADSSGRALPAEALPALQAGTADRVVDALADVTARSVLVLVVTAAGQPERIDVIPLENGSATRTGPEKSRR
jgi:hypothetical protein